MYARRAVHSVQRLCSKPKSSFDIDIVTKDYETKTKWAAANYKNRGKYFPCLLNFLLTSIAVITLFSGKIFRMVLPPPNVTGKLHLGHALTVTIEDTLCRHHRIKGGVAHWIPGFDHAGIATQSVVERELWRNKGLRRDQLSRKEFVEHCMQWSETNSSAIREQLNMLGATLDWENSYYTLDEKFSSAVVQAFVTLHGDGLIYRDRRIEVNRVDVNSSTKMTIPSPEGGKRVVVVGTMYRVKYPLDGSDSSLEVATTRPETMFADVALAVNPADERYSRFIGKCVRHPLLPARKLPVLADSGVQMDKGTGVLKITPSHDILDWEIARRHWEEILAVDPTAKARNCMEPNGTLNSEACEFAGLDRFEARAKVTEKLASLGFLSGTMKHTGQIVVCSRTGDIVEPRLTEQWFMDTAELYAKAEQSLKNGEIKVIPKSQEQKLFDWFSNKDPWCLSRQLVWGHRIPAYKSENSPWFIASSLEEARKHFGESVAITQDEDVLDTWFSSSLIPLVNAGWPGPQFNPSAPPLDIMETGWDILGFWVARMIIVSMRLSGGHLPFSQILLHGLIRDSSGKKMSKSLGNVIDPLDVIEGISKEKMVERIKSSSLSQEEIAAATSAISSRYPDGILRSGTDALRFALLRHDLLASDIPLNIVDFSSEGLRFCNKLWNMVAYMGTVADKSPTLKDVDSEHPADEWIISRLAGTLKQETTKRALWNSDLPRISQINTTLNRVVQPTLVQLSVFMPFVAQHLYEKAFNREPGKSTNEGVICKIETTKRALWNSDLPRIAQINTTLNRVVQPTLVQLSVFMPFIAQHLYEKAFNREPASIYFDFVKPAFFQFFRNTELESDMDTLLAAVSAVRSLRHQFQLPSSMLFTGCLRSDDVSENFPRLLPILTDLANLEVSEVAPLAHHIPEGFMTCPIPGTTARLSLKIQESHRSEFVHRLEKLMKKSEERREQFLGKAEKYEAIVFRDKKEGKTKPHVIAKNERKARQARGVACSAEEEANRIRDLLQEMAS
ncbi:valine--tRNA ligase [Ancylostoma duodenale]|uniref:valine--tRNA ligase n=1 Tax=Ancylostoma duodenale TaxID=51022 RepID=A0A0C2GNF8_9BILA|nr:valine--tRNA ligase [Ancylostoma duodenale]